MTVRFRRQIEAQCARANVYFALNPILRPNETIDAANPAYVTGNYQHIPWVVVKKCIERAQGSKIMTIPVRRFNLI